jgi:hypothetical protein
MFGNEKLEAGKEYVLGEKDTLTIQRFKFYVSGIVWLNGQGKELKQDKGYYLVDMDDPASLTIALQAPPPSAVTIRFLIGVDSIRNVSGVQSGALDPLQGMFWTWNSGYIMAKLEGTANRSEQIGRRFTYHVGGFRTGQATQRWVTLNWLKEYTGEGIHIAANAKSWFEGQYKIDPAEQSVCHSPGSLAIQLADNYSHMFTVIPTRSH